MKNKPYPLYTAPLIHHLKDLVMYCAQTYKDRTAFQFIQDEKAVTTISYCQFMHDINYLGTALHALGLDHGKAALVGENSYYWIVAYFAIVNGENVVVPLDPELMEEQLTALINKTDVQFIICSKRSLDKIQKVRERLHCQQIIVLETDLPQLLQKGQKLIEIGETAYLDIRIQPNRCSTIVYTSGTTCQPKGVILSHKNIVSDTVASIKSVFFGGTSLLVLPLYHTFAFTANVLCLLLSGQPISLNRNLRDLSRDLIRYRPQNMILVPMIVESLYKQIWIKAQKNGKDGRLRKLLKISHLFMSLGIDLRKSLFSRIHDSFGGRLEFIITGGAPIHEKYIRGFRELGIQVLNGYGITECSPVLAVNRNHFYRDKSVGQILDSVTLKVDDGEILVKGDMVASGYYEDEEMTVDAFRDGWFRTGDLGYMDEDGFLYITGRKKNIIVLSNGKNVSPEELEEYLYALDYVKEAVVYQNGDQIEAEVYIGDNGETNKKRMEEDLKAINDGLPIYKTISKVIFRDVEFSKTPTKKIRRTKL